ncbi:MAG TPA: oligopeptide transporter, OPT family [Verrucomicrobiales bacterium]|nr:oligopeptide transporter, OPT family [Verrucomicrobiales bacterium]
MSKNQSPPYIKAASVLPELTIKAVFLGVVLSMILSAANAYLGLFAGMTVSASIPAAVISMAILRLFSKSNILENNAVQTAASAGESLAAGVIFTFPALLLMGYWTKFNYVQTTLIAGCGGVLGVMFTIPLRNALIVKQNLQFPEGVATAEVLKTGEEGGKAVKYLAISASMGALFKLAESGLGLWHGILDKAAIIGSGTKAKGYAYFGMNLSPALMAVGYIVGLKIAVLVFIGGAISWWIAIPVYLWANGIPEGANAVDLGYEIWTTKIRFLGVGAMVVGGLWALLSISSALKDALDQAIQAFTQNRSSKKKPIRTELDTPMKWVVIGIAAMVIPIFALYYNEIKMGGISSLMAVIMVVAGFLFSAVAGYMAGLVGSSNNPISGVTIATILSSSLLLYFLMGSDAASGPAAAILIGAVVCCAAAIAGDNMQDLKAGHILGATPWKQQVMQMIGVISAAVVIAPVLTLLNTAYGFGPKTAELPKALAAPQATLMKSVADGVFGGSLPWGFIFTGSIIGVAVIIADQVLKAKKSHFRMPVLAVAIGLYLPFELDSAIMLGGLVAWAANRGKKKSSDAVSSKPGLLFASGLITGEALVGILLAIPIAAGIDISIIDKPIGTWPGILFLAGLCYWLFTLAKKKTI